MTSATNQKQVCMQCRQLFHSSRTGMFCDRCYRARAAENRRRKYMGLPSLPRGESAQIEPKARARPKPTPGARSVWRIEGPHWGRESTLQAAELRTLEREGGLEPGDRAIDPQGKVYIWLGECLAPEREASPLGGEQPC